MEANPSGWCCGAVTRRSSGSMQPNRVVYVPGFDPLVVLLETEVTRG